MLFLDGAYLTNTRPPVFRRIGAARYASAFACHSGVSFIGGFGGMCRLLRQSTSQTPLQSGSFASAAHFCVAASAAAVCAGGFDGEQPAAAIIVVTAAANNVLLISRSLRPPPAGNSTGKAEPTAQSVTIVYSLAAARLLGSIT